MHDGDPHGAAVGGEPVGEAPGDLRGLRVRGVVEVADALVVAAGIAVAGGPAGVVHAAVVVADGADEEARAAGSRVGDRTEHLVDRQGCLADLDQDDCHAEHRMPPG